MTSCHDIYLADEQAAAPRRIVVGVDCEEPSLEALRWAMTEAHHDGGHVDAVLVCQSDPCMSFAFGDYPFVASASAGGAHGRAVERLRTAVAAVDPAHEVPVATVVVHGKSVASALARHARGAALLVVGATQRHGLGVLLGSTAGGCIRSAACPVVVVPQAMETLPST